MKGLGLRVSFIVFEGGGALGWLAQASVLGAQASVVGF